MDREKFSLLLDKDFALNERKISKSGVDTQQPEKTAKVPGLDGN
jgi:hypothetical protein